MRTPEEVIHRKVALLKRVGFIEPSYRHIHVRRAITPADLRAAYALVHTVFLEAGYIDPMPGAVRARPFEALPEMATFVAEVGGELAGVMSMVPDSPDLGLPSDKAFAAELGQLRGQKRRVAEVTNLAIKPKYRNSGVFLALAQPILAHAACFRYDDIFIAISPGHSGFFESILQFDAWGDARDYSAEKADIVEGKRWDLRDLERRLLEADRLLGPEAFLHAHFYSGNPWHQYVKSLAVLAARAFRNADSLRDLFVTTTHLLDRCAPEQREAIGRRWGTDVLAAVCHTEDAQPAYAMQRRGEFPRASAGRRRLAQAL